MTVPVEGVAGGGTAYGFNDGGLNAEPLKQSLDPAQVPTADLVNVWCMPNSINVGSQETPRPLEPVSVLFHAFVSAVCSVMCFLLEL